MMICFQQRDWGIDMILLQRALFGVAAGFWLVAGVLATFGVVDFGLTSGARGLGVATDRPRSSAGSGSLRAGRRAVAAVGRIRGG